VKKLFKILSLLRLFRELRYTLRGRHGMAATAPATATAITAITGTRGRAIMPALRPPRQAQGEASGAGAAPQPPLLNGTRSLPSIESEANRTGQQQMAARAYWKGQIRLALVSIPVEIFTATKSGAAIAFNQIHEPTGKRIRYEKVVEGVGR
jgi:hypothetical protein